MKSILNQSQVCELLGIPRSTFKQSLLPLMLSEGVAVDISEDDSQPRYAFIAADLWRWIEYVEKRKALIELGRWSTKRAYSIEDMQHLVDDGVFDGEIDHPVFRVANNQ